MVKRLLLAGLALTCATGADATTFTFDIDHPVTVTTRGRTFSYFYSARSLGTYAGSGAAQSASFEVQVRYFDETRNEFVPNFSGGGIASATENASFTDSTNVNYNEYDGAAQFFLTFKTTTDQKILITDLDAFEPPENGGPGSFIGFNVLPEPSTWLLMLSGFGMIGYAMRRRPEIRIAFANR